MSTIYRLSQFAARIGVSTKTLQRWDGRVEVHYAVEVKEIADCGTATLGVDKGYTEVLVDKAAVIATEDLTAPMGGRKFSKDTNRRLAAWTKGVIAEALETVSRRRGSTLVLVNPAYTSQADHRNGCLLGKRVGDSFYCFDGVVLQADENAALNVLARLFDLEIDRWTPYRKVKSILFARTERRRLGLLNQDSSCGSRHPSTESEAPENLNVQLCLGF